MIPARIVPSGNPPTLRACLVALCYIIQRQSVSQEHMPHLISASSDKTHTKNENYVLETGKHHGGPNKTLAYYWEVQSNVNLSFSAPLRKSGRMDAFGSADVTDRGADWAQIHKLWYAQTASSAIVFLEAATLNSSDTWAK